MKSSKQLFKANENTSSESYIEEEIRHAKRNRDFANSQKGDQNNCRKCMGRGMFEDFKVKNNRVYEYAYLCPNCKGIVDKQTRIEESNSVNELKNMTFNSWVASNDMTQNVFSTAKQFVRQQDKPFFYIGGGIGTGKTHICMSIVHELSEYKNFEVLWWKKDIGKLKKSVSDYNDEEGLKKYNEVEILYIDDMLATQDKREFEIITEIIEHRYNNEKTTIISSEHTLRELIEISEPLGTRIAQHSKGFNITMELGNHRLR